MNVEKLVAKLKEHGEWAKGNERETPITLGDDIEDAVCVIEALQRKLKAQDKLVDRLEDDVARLLGVENK